MLALFWPYVYVKAPEKIFIYLENNILKSSKVILLTNRFYHINLNVFFYNILYIKENISILIYAYSMNIILDFNYFDARSCYLFLFKIQ